MHPPRLAGAAALCAAALLSAAPPLVAQAGSQGARRDPEMEAPEVHDLRIRGVRAVDEDELRNSIVTDESGCNSLLYSVICLFTKSSAVYTRRYLDREELARDVLRMRVFYFLRGYRDAQVDTLVQRHGDDAVDVTFAVQEGPPTTVTDVAVTGVDTLFRPAQLDRLVLVDSGEPLSLVALDSTVLGLRAALGNLGYADAEVDTATAVDTSAHRARVQLVVEPHARTTVGAVRIQGLERLEASTVRNSLTLHEGDVFRREELFRSQRNLYESQLFRRSVIDAEGADSVKTLVVTVTEADLQRVRASAGFNTIDFVQVEGRYTHFNFLGNARRLTLNATLGNLLAPQLEDEFIFQRVAPDGIEGDRTPFLRPTWLLSAELRQPWFRSPNNTISTSVFAHRRATPGVVVDRGQGATASFTREVTARATASLTYRFEVTRIEAGDVYFCVNFGVCDISTINTLTGAQRLSPVMLLGNVDRSDDPLEPTHGYIARLELEHASAATASDYRYNRVMVEGSVYRPFWRGTLAGHLRLGRTWPLASTVTPPEAGPLFDDAVIHPRKRFYAGGSRSVRGFGESQLGPRVLTIAPSKLRGERVVDGGTEYDRCPPSIPIASCPLVAEVDSLQLQARDFTPRPLGSPAVAEASVEYRMRVWGPLSGAVFLDGAILPAGDDAFFTLDDNFMALTPGIGVRYQSPVGPIRVDVGYNPSPAEALPVFTQVEQDGVLRIVQLGEGLPPAERPRFVYEPNKSFLSRLVLHLSIGEAF
ncbi:MAG TPA: BamA/TamA family outer membrane protein [Gemmatimonadaceae bacterium]|nr:BamA/TamA family outer membrane protein [Gemmatimonadaceae bacterium]